MNFGAWRCVEVVLVKYAISLVKCPIRSVLYDIALALGILAINYSFCILHERESKYRLSWSVRFIICSTVLDRSPV